MNCARLGSMLLVVPALCAGCAASPGLAMRTLSGQDGKAPRPELERDSAQAPRIGAPGGSGAGSRSVVPAQSGNEAVGGLLGGNGKSGRRG